MPVKTVATPAALSPIICRVRGALTVVDHVFCLVDARVAPESCKYEWTARHIARGSHRVPCASVSHLIGGITRSRVNHTRHARTSLELSRPCKHRPLRINRCWAGLSGFVSCAEFQLTSSSTAAARAQEPCCASLSSSSTVEAVLERPPRRLVKPAAADREAALLEAGRGACPVLCVDALLPYQRLPLAFDDEILTELLEDIGEGGLVVATSWDARRRRGDEGARSRVVEGGALRGLVRCSGRGRRRARRPLAALRRHGRAGRGRRVAALGPRAPGGRGARRWFNASRAASSSTASPSTPRPRRPSLIRFRRSSGPLLESTSWNRTATRPPALREPKIWRRPSTRARPRRRRGGSRRRSTRPGRGRRTPSSSRSWSRRRAAAAAARQRLRRAAVFTGAARRRVAARDRGALPATRAGGAPGRRRHGFWGAAAPAGVRPRGPPLVVPLFCLTK